MNQYWSWVLAIWGITGLWVAGQRRRALGWAIGLSVQAVWVAYALATKQYGFIVSAIFYAFIYLHNFVTWRAVERAQVEQNKAPGC